MNLNLARARQYLKDFEFTPLFVEELGWDRPKAPLDVAVDDQTWQLSAIAEKRGMVAFECAPSPDGRPPEYGLRRKIERQVAKSAHEHLVVYVDAKKTTQIWQWVRREPGRPLACREHHYGIGQPGDSLIQKLQAIAFSFEEEEGLALPDVTSRVRAAFDVDRVTKRFYDRFKTEHKKFLGFLKGIPDEELQRWYASVMLNRLMFIYFIQKKTFLDGDQDYLRNKLTASKQEGKNRFYRDFLCPLFFEGFAKRKDDRSKKARKLLGEVPYLNGGIFMPHEIEQRHGDTIEIADAAFTKLFCFFDQYHWHLDERPLRADNEINPDVLGYIFEKYINQKQMGAYYTKEDITEYISTYTAIPRIFDMARPKCKIAFEGKPSVWDLLQADPDRYIYPAVRSGVIDEEGGVIPNTALPDFVQKGMADAKARMFDQDYNLGGAVIEDAAGRNLALPTETWREYVERRKRCLELRERLAAGEVRDVNDLITYNLDLRQFAQDAIETCEGPELLRTLWQAIQNVTILDPACGSGAFLFAALNILESLYEACLDRMEAFVADLGRPGRKGGSKKYSDFRDILAQVELHANRRYFVFKSIIVNNLFGVDIMEEAVEICKLRLFLKLVAQVEHVDKVEPLPDIDFNIRAGNSLVGYATYDQVKKAVTQEAKGQKKLLYDDTMDRIEEKAQDVDRLFTLFRQQQTELGGEVTPADKEELRSRLASLEDELNQYLAGEHGANPKSEEPYEEWLHAHRPFHWFVEFYGIVKQGGFDVVIGNPPYAGVPKDLSRSLLSSTFDTALTQWSRDENLYTLFAERSLQLLRIGTGHFGMILPLSLSFSTKKPFVALRQVLSAEKGLWIWSHFDRIPSALFGNEVRTRCTVALLLRTPSTECPGAATTPLLRWNAEYRECLFKTMAYARLDISISAGIPKVSSQIQARSLSKNSI